VALVTAGLLVRNAWFPHPRAGAAAFVEGSVSQTAPAPRTHPIVGRIAPAGPGECKAILAKRSIFELKPDRLTDHVCKNVLIADGAFVKVEFKNESLEELAVIPREGHPFRVTTTVENASGKPVSFEQSGLRSLKRVNLVDPRQKPVVLRPGQTEVQWISITGPGALEVAIQPGRYRIRVVGTCLRASDRAELRIEPAPFWVTITAEDLHDWRKLLNEPDPAGVEEEKP